MVHVLVALTALLVADAPQSRPDFAAELRSLEDAQRRADEAFHAKLVALPEEEREKAAIDPSKNPAADYFARYRALAERASGTETELAAFDRMFQVAFRSGLPSKERAADLEKAIDGALARHFGSKELHRLVPGIGMGIAMHAIDRIKGEAALRRIADGAGDRVARAAAAMSLADGLMRPLKGVGSPARAAEGRALFERLARDFADTDYGRTAKSWLFRTDRLQIGMVAPDFTAKDQDGKTFKLSDYRGKVVVLDFWGFW